MTNHCMLATGKHGYRKIRCALQHVHPTIAVQLLGFLKEITNNRLVAIRFCCAKSGGRPMVAPTVFVDRYSLNRNLYILKRQKRVCVSQHTLFFYFFFFFRSRSQAASPVSATAPTATQIQMAAVSLSSKSMPLRTRMNRLSMYLVVSRGRDR